MEHTTHHILSSNIQLFNLKDVDMSYKFNHCTIIMYYAGTYLKDRSSLTYHSDCVYSVYIVIYNRLNS